MQKYNIIISLPRLKCWLGNGQTNNFLTKAIPCGRCRGHICFSIDLKIGQNVCLDEILSNLGHQGIIN